MISVFFLSENSLESETLCRGSKFTTGKYQGNPLSIAGNGINFIWYCWPAWRGGGHVALGSDSCSDEAWQRRHLWTHESRAATLHLEPSHAKRPHKAVLSPRMRASYGGNRTLVCYKVKRLNQFQHRTSSGLRNCGITSPLSPVLCTQCPPLPVIDVCF
jgi:hypothetical protein